MATHEIDILDRRLRSVAGLTEPASKSLSSLPFERRTLKARETLYPPGAEELPCYILLEGSVIRFKMRSDGTRAIVAFELPGDIINLEALLLGQTDCGVTTATECSVAVVRRATMIEALKSKDGLEAALWRYAFVKSATLEEWLLNIGKRSPLGRIAHLLMEIQSRLASIGDTGSGGPGIYVTSHDIADAMGLQEIVATRIVHELASDGVISRAGDLIVVNDAERLAKTGEFRADYLHMAT